MCGLRLLQLLFNFRVLFLLIYRSLPLLLSVIQSSLHPRYLISTGVRLLLVFQVLVLHLPLGVTGAVMLFVSPGNVRVSVVYLLRYLLLSGCSQIGQGTW